MNKVIDNVFYPRYCNTKQQRRVKLRKRIFISGTKEEHEIWMKVAKSEPRRTLSSWACDILNKHAAKELKKMEKGNGKI